MTGIQWKLIICDCNQTQCLLTMLVCLHTNPLVHAAATSTADSTGGCMRKRVKTNVFSKLMQVIHGKLTPWMSTARFVTMIPAGITVTKVPPTKGQTSMFIISRKTHHSDTHRRTFVARLHVLTQHTNSTYTTQTE